MSEADNLKLPFEGGNPDPNTVYLIPIDRISIPSLRVTSTFDEMQTTELIESLKTEGQRDPVKCVWSNGQIVLSDGFNRIMGLKALGVQVVKALIKIGSLVDVQIENIITARHRGKENPAQTAEVIRDLLENEHQSKDEIKTRLGLSDSTFRKLYLISGLPNECKDLVKWGKLGVGAAYHIAQLSDAAAAITLANQAVSWGYTEEQVKIAVSQILNPSYDSSKAPVVFDTDGRPKIVYPMCMGCNLELQSIVYPINCCADCFEAVKAFFAQFYAPDATHGMSNSTEATAPAVQSGFVQE